MKKVPGPAELSLNFPHASVGARQRNRSGMILSGYSLPGETWELFHATHAGALDGLQILSRMHFNRLTKNEAREMYDTTASNHSMISSGAAAVAVVPRCEQMMLI